MQHGHNPEIIRAGRRINEEMSTYIASRVLKSMLRRDIDVLGARILILGLAFKENCSDVRNSKVFDMIASLADYKCDIDVYDPRVYPNTELPNLNAALVAAPASAAYDAIILAVAHNEFVSQGAKNIRQYGKPNHVLFDLKYAFKKSETDERL